MATQLNLRIQKELSRESEIDGDHVELSRFGEIDELGFRDMIARVYKCYYVNKPLECCKCMECIRRCFTGSVNFPPFFLFFLH